MAKRGCLWRMVVWGIASVMLLFAGTFVATLLPSADAVDEQPHLADSLNTLLSRSAGTELSREALPFNVTMKTATARAELVAATVTPVPTALTPNALPIVNSSTNLCDWPGTNYPIVGGMAPGDVLNVVMASPDGEWLQLDSGAWIALIRLGITDDWG